MGTPKQRSGSDMPLPSVSALCGVPDGPDFAALITNAILRAFFGRFKLLITAIITSVRGRAREGAI
jgi:hypothetical protein